MQQKIIEWVVLLGFVEPSVAPWKGSVRPQDGNNMWSDVLVTEITSCKLSDLLPIGVHRFMHNPVEEVVVELQLVVRYEQGIEVPWELARRRKHIVEGSHRIGVSLSLGLQVVSSVNDLS